MNKALKICLIVVASLIALLALTWIGTAVAYSSPNYANRMIANLWAPTGVKDYAKFTSREIKNSPPVFNFKKQLNEDVVNSMFVKAGYLSGGKEMPIEDLDTFLKNNSTTSFIVIKDDSILYEKYFNGYQRDSICTSFSVAKSFDSTLIGLAIEDGYIKSANEPIINYLPELNRDGLGSVTIWNLLMMSSGIHYAEAYLPWGDDALTYYYPDLRKIALTVHMDGKPGEHFWYNNYHPLLEGMILERATHKHVATYLEEKIWSRIGMEFPASWSLDSKETGFEKMESGINARAIDFAKFGRLFLNKGNWEGTQVVPSEWITEATTMSDDARASNGNYYSLYENSPMFHSHTTYYKYHWWGLDRGSGNYDYFAAGNFGQYIYVCPLKNLIIVRNGTGYGNVDAWPGIFFRVAGQF
ncbi:MAG: serine hydrolase [Chloroflexi bacterium]|nr:serine hydrolase [Chloroflexota bacterium]